MAKKTLKKDVADITHDEARRPNIPTSEMKPLVEDSQKAPIKVSYAKRDPDLDPQLIWRGKYDGDETLTVKAPPLYIQEKVHPKALIEDLKAASAKRRPTEYLNLFGDFNGMPKGVDKTDFYKHEQNWTNRMILGDSLQVMASLAEREKLRGKVQMIYIDPPYGVKFNSNFQWSTNSRDVKDGRDYTREPEQVKAFRDTWEDGIHSYLSYLRDRLIAARDLLTESGSIFVQIGDENVHLVRALMDEVFGRDNFVSFIPYATTTGFSTSYIATIFNYVIWFAKDKAQLKYRQLYMPKTPGEAGATLYKPVSSISAIKNYPFQGDILISSDNITSQGSSVSSEKAFKCQNKEWYPPANMHWKTTKAGMERLDKASRIMVNKSFIRYLRMFDDFAVTPMTNLWSDTSTGGFNDDKVYVVQTNTKVITRCMLMATDPGDLVLDPTCGSGTTAYVVEQWGRRWITIDTSRVALALARARLMGAKYPYYLMVDSKEGQQKEAEISGAPPSGAPCGDNISLGFVYKRVPHITLGSIANNVQIDDIYDKWQRKLVPLLEKLNRALGEKWEEWEVPAEADDSWPEEAREPHKQWRAGRIARQKEIDASIAARAEFEPLYDKPYEDSGKIRVAGPFTVESISPYRVLHVDEDDNVIDPGQNDGSGESRDFARMILENLRAAGVQQARKEGRIIFTSLEPFAAGNMIAAIGKYQEGEEEKSAAIFIGPEFGTVSLEDLVEAAREAAFEHCDILVACAFNFEANAGELESRGKMPILKARMNAELHMGEALRKNGQGNLFVVFGEPDIEVKDAGGGLIQVAINGVDVYNPAAGSVVSDNAGDIACWFIDTNYNAESFFVRQAYFLGQKNPYEALKRALNAEVERDAWESLHSRVSRPFPKPETGRIAVKVINHLGDEVMKVFKV